MSVRSLGYDNEEMDKIFCYFMRVVLHLQKSGVEDLPLENNLPAPYKSFLDTAMEIFLQSPRPELARLLLEAEHSAFLGNSKISHEAYLGLQVIKELAWHVHYDDDYYGYLLSTENIWGNSALEYATLTFYPNLPEQIKCKYQVHELIQNVPTEMFQLDNY